MPMAMQQQHEQDEGEGKEDVGGTHDHRVDPTAVVARDRTQREADDQGDRHSDHADQHGHPRRDKHAREHVATEVVGAEGVRPRRWRAQTLGRQRVVDLIGVVGREVPFGGEAGDLLGAPDGDEDDDDAQADDGQPVALETPPRVAPEAERLLASEPLLDDVGL
jgi:hypothetical protein